MMEKFEVPQLVFVVEDANGVALRNYRTGTMFYTRQERAARRLPPGGSVVAFELVRKGAVEGRLA